MIKGNERKGEDVAQVAADETKLSGIGLENALREGRLTRPPVHLTGMVKVSEREGYVQFSQAGCDAWVEIPTTLIEQAEHVGYMPCREHSHPQMRITLKSLGNQESEVLLALLAQRRVVVQAQPMLNEQRSWYQQSLPSGAGMPFGLPQPAALLSRRRIGGGRVGGVGGRFFDGGGNPCCCTWEDYSWCPPGYMCVPRMVTSCISCPTGSVCGCDFGSPYCDDSVPPPV